jgi:hypothetical protein
MRRAAMIAAVFLLLPATGEAQTIGPMCGGKYIGKTERDTGVSTYDLTSKTPGTFPSSRTIQFRMRWTYYKCRRSWRLTLQPWISDGSAVSALRLYLRDEHGNLRRTPMRWRWVEGWLQTQTMTRRTRRWYPESALMAGFTMWKGDDAETRAADWTSPFDGTGWDIRQPRRKRG